MGGSSAACFPWAIDRYARVPSEDDSESDSAPATTSITSTESTSSGAANTAEVVATANAFLDTLSDEQRETSLYNFNDEAHRKLRLRPAAGHQPARSDFRRAQPAPR